MKYYVVANAVVCICAFLGFFIGIVKYMKPRSAIYAKMIVLSLGSIGFGRMFLLIRLLTGGNAFERFQLGFLGSIGSLLFLFSANYGAMDRLADDKSKKFFKYRCIALIAPMIALVFYLAGFVLQSNFPDAQLWMIQGGILTVFVMLSSYFHLKHLILPDVDYGIINCLKLYNLIALIYAGLCMAEAFFFSRRLSIGVLTTDILMGIAVLLLVPVLTRGIKKWTI